MKNIGKMIDMDEFLQYSYLKEEKMFKFESSTQYSSVFQIKEMLEIVGILDHNKITYILDANQNIVLNKVMDTKVF